MAAASGTSRAELVWRGLVIADLGIVALFPIALLAHPYTIFTNITSQILLYGVALLGTRASVVLAERWLLTFGRGIVVFAGRAVAVLAALYGGDRFQSHYYGTWYDFILGAVLAYTFAGTAVVGLASLARGVWRLSALLTPRASGPPAPRPPTADATTDPGTGGTGDARPRPPAPAASATPATEGTGGAASPVVGPGPPSTGRTEDSRGAAREGLLGLSGVFLGVAGLVLSAEDVAKLAAALLLGGAFAAAVFLFTRPRKAG